MTPFLYRNITFPDINKNPACRPQFRKTQDPPLSFHGMCSRLWHSRRIRRVWIWNPKQIRPFLFVSLYTPLCPVDICDIIALRGTCLYIYIKFCVCHVGINVALTTKYVCHFFSFDPLYSSVNYWVISRIEYCLQWGNINGRIKLSFKSVPL